MVSRFAAFVIWAAVAASIVFWALRLWVAPSPVPAHAMVVASSSGFNGNLERLLGADTVAAVPSTAEMAAPADPRFKLIGVVAPRSAAARAEGLALIALDDKPPRAYRVGAVVDGDMVLQAVHSRGASLGLRGEAVKFDLVLPALPPPATGVPASVGSFAAPMQSPQGLPARPLPPPVPSAPVAEPPMQPEAPSREVERPDDVAPPDRPMVPAPTSSGRQRPV